MDSLMELGSLIENENALMQIYEGVKHTEISEEFILPDYLPDVKKIIKVSAKPRIDTKFVSDAKIEYEGDVIVCMLFSDEENRLRNVTFKAAFSDMVEIADLRNECIANLIPEVESVTCRMVNPRRVCIRVRVDTECSVWSERSFCPELSGELSGKRVESLKREAQGIKLITAGERDLTLSADIEADGALPQIAEVIDCNVEMSFFDCKASDDKVLCRGEMPVTVFYSSNGDDGENYTVLFRKLPIAQMIAAEGADESYECMARGGVDDVKVEIGENSFGEKRILSFDITYRMYLNCVKKDVVTVTEDAYLSDAVTQTVTEKVKLCTLSRNYSVSFGGAKVFSRQELELEEAEAVFEVSAIPKIVSVKKNESNGKLSICGEADTEAIFKGADGLYSVRYEVPFETELDSTGVPDSFIYNADIVCMCAKGRLDAEKYYTELEIQLGLMILGTQELQILKKAEFKRAENVVSAPSMRFYYPDKDETLWEICKSFGISRAELEENNTLSGDGLPQVIVIPMLKKR